VHGGGADARERDAVCGETQVVEADRMARDCVNRSRSIGQHQRHALTDLDVDSAANNEDDDDTVNDKDIVDTDDDDDNVFSSVASKRRH